jgi:EAL domain-containing protein (putative c-di-GMP-specific phosphodiesterase class I)
MVLYYQPKVDIRSGDTREVEALIRWQHPERGFLPPGQFIALAEETSLIRPLTEWAIEEALRQRTSWAQMGFEIVTGVNLSARTLHDPQLVNTIMSRLRSWDTEPGRLKLEITESAIMIDPDRAMATLRRLHDEGVRLSIDDFGTGYSSLAYLRRLPIDEIKIDRSFVTDMVENPADASIVRSIIELSHNLSLTVVAEGVETHAAIDALRAMGCDLIQGYVYSKPIPGSALASWLLKEQEPRVTDAS